MSSSAGARHLAESAQWLHAQGSLTDAIERTPRERATVLELVAAKHPAREWWERFWAWARSLRVEA